MNISDVKTKEDIPKFFDNQFIHFLMARGRTREYAEKALRETKQLN